jgi:hypothetical protein
LRKKHELRGSPLGPDLANYEARPRRTFAAMSIALSTHPIDPTNAIEVGTSVDVKNRFIGSWSCGFEIAELVEDGYMIRRNSDGSVLPDSLSFDEVRPR